MDSSDSFRRIFNPRAVAIVGASEDTRKMGGWCMSSFIHGSYPGKVFPINPKSREIRGIKSYASLSEVPERIDLAIVVVPSSAVASVLVECADRGAKGAVIISAGFREMDDPNGQLMQKEIASLAQDKGIRLIGPNTFGMIHTHAHLNASFSPALNLLKKGDISMIGQSGGVCHLFMYTAIHEGIGLNKVVGLGNRSDVDFSDLVEYLDQDPDTRSIALYIEGIEEPGSLLKSAKSVAQRKPIVALKGGKSEAIAKASIAHTGAMTGRHALYQASFSQYGIVAVHDPIELLDVAKALATLPPPKGDRVAVLSGQAGPGILMTDLCIERGLTLAKFDIETLEKLKVPTRNQVLRSNPVDLGFAFTRELFEDAVTAVLKDPNVDAIALFLADPADTFKTFFSDGLAALARGLEKPVVLCYFTGEQSVSRKVKEEMEGKGLLFYPQPLRAVNALAGLVRYGKICREE
ncbi:MAG: CoA-binding protein [Desulfobacteraceae bacterium]|jgi:acyl-CoA synthetase (NDP forming)